jgi:uncharacterized hydrophobic protein (TIGR00271 family)
MITKRLLTIFRITGEKEDFETVAKSIENGAIFKGTNLWILIFAIFIASLGLNVNSTAVIIGAMLISPLMGPIIGIGLGVGINDLPLLRKSFSNLASAVIVALTTSTLYFSLTPLNQAHSELLARTSPNIYDVLIALFGGFACTLAIFSKNKGNVLPGAAIATALMPPICTAGYGLATWQLNFFLGAMYLFVINTVFIASAGLFTIRLLRFPHKVLPDLTAQTQTRRIITAVILLTLIPSVYFGYDIVKQSQFTQNANLFIEKESALPNDYLLNTKIDPKSKTISLTYGGKEISKMEIESLRKKLSYYNLDDVALEVKQGFAYLDNNNNNTSDPQLVQLGAALDSKQAEINSLRLQLDSMIMNNAKGNEIFEELRIQYPALKEVIYTPNAFVTYESQKTGHLPLFGLKFERPLPLKEKRKITEWLKVRLKQEDLKIIFE